MNAFYKHRKDSMKFGYRCFDRILLNGLIQPFQQPEGVIGFFNAYCDSQRLTRNCTSAFSRIFWKASSTVANCSTWLGRLC